MWPAALQRAVSLRQQSGSTESGALAPPAVAPPRIAAWGEEGSQLGAAHQLLINSARAGMSFSSAEGGPLHVEARASKQPSLVQLCSESEALRLLRDGSNGQTLLG